MKVSIIIPAYNAEKTLARCLDSVLNQTYQNIEVIVINDGSKDNTLQICTSYADKDDRIKVIDKPNSGVSNSRNKGIEASTGDYVTFIDSDDTIETDCIKTLIDNIEESVDFIRYNFNPIGPTTFNNNLFDLANKTLNIKENSEIIFRHFLTSKEAIPNLIFLLLIRKDIIDKLKFNETLFMMEDVEFYFQLFKTAKKGKFIDIKMYNYYNNPVSVTHNKNNFTKIIYGILDTNRVLNAEIKNIVDKNIILDMNASHLSIISQYLINICKINKNTCIKEITKLQNDDYFKYLLSNSHLNTLPKKNRILLNMIKNNNTILMNLYLITLKILYKIKD